MDLKEQYKKETGNYAFDLQKRPTANYAQWLEQRLGAGQLDLLVISPEKLSELLLLQRMMCKNKYYYCSLDGLTREETGKEIEKGPIPELDDIEDL